MSKYTPGPWFAVKYELWFVLQTNDKHNSASDLLHRRRCPVNAEANAKLAAAAPDMLEALRGVVNHFSNEIVPSKEDRQLLQKIQVAINKATL